MNIQAQYEELLGSSNMDKAERLSFQQAWFDFTLDGQYQWCVEVVLYHAEMAMSTIVAQPRR